MNKKGFTLIELLAVIIILGILMIIAIPSVTKYISDSRKNAYVDTAKEVIGGARNLVNGGKLGMYDTNSTYYIPASYINTENALKSPYGELVKAYVGVVYDGKGYEYYWISSDDAGQGFDEITSLNDLDPDNLKSDLNPGDIDLIIKKTGIGLRNNIRILNANGSWEDYNAEDYSNVKPHYVENPVCRRATSLHSFTCGSTVTDECTQMGANEPNLTVYFGNNIEKVTEGLLKNGDAFDCDINGDSTFDSLTERFYYVGQNGGNATLIYYNNYVSDTIIWVNKNQFLPSSSNWPNADVIRHLSYNELITLCGSEYYGNFYYLKENAYSFYSTQKCWWIDGSEYTVVCGYRPTLSTYNYYSKSGVRPVIEVNLSKISY